MWSHQLAILLQAFLLFVGTTQAQENPLFEAVRRDYPSAILNALAEGADINEKGPGGQTPLIHAILTGKSKAVKTLLDSKADYTIPEKDGYTIFHAAGFQGRAEIVNILAEFLTETKGSQEMEGWVMMPHKDGFFPLHRACWGREPRHAETVQAFIDLGVPYDFKAVNRQSCMDMTKNKQTERIIMGAGAKGSMEKDL